VGRTVDRSSNPHAKVVVMILDMAAQQFSIALSACVRLARQDDLRRLEWFGMLTPFREILEKDFERAEQGELIYLVAESNSYPIGQVEVDLTKKGNLGIGVLMALRVLPPFQNLGIGSQLLQAAEQAIRDHQLQIAELGVAKDNPGAFRLYVRHGYQVAGEECESWSYRTPDGETMTTTEAEWIMQKGLCEVSMSLGQSLPKYNRP
jgi:ribosomal protein S18 acetylase RimI-like enzyme